MALASNPVMQRELLVNLRTFRSVLILALYQIILCGVVLLAWPTDRFLDLTENPESTRRLVDLFFLGNFVLAALLTPTFAAGSISGERERKTFEMLLASPLHPYAIVWGKWLAALTHLTILIFTSLPVVILCLPLGGVSVYEVLAAYFLIVLGVVTFGMVSVYCGTIFKRTASSLVASYLLILPAVLFVVWFWYVTRESGQFRLTIINFVFPGMATAIAIPLFYITASRLLYPPDSFATGQAVVDLEQESQQAVGLVIQRDQFPDRLFAPAIRNSLMPDRTNPVFDKEMRSEIFGQGTLMLRLSIQISMILAIPLMASLLFVWRPLAPWYICYVLLFNLLVGPVFSAGSVTSERERQTLDLLLTTLITPTQILWGKLVSGLRVSTVLTAFLLWPLLLATVMVGDYWTNLPTLAAYVIVVAISCLTTANIALFCSTITRKTSTSLVLSYVLIAILFFVPPAYQYFIGTYFATSALSQTAYIAAMFSPFSTVHEIPLYVDDVSGSLKNWTRPSQGESDVWLGYRLEDMLPFASFVVIALTINFILGLFIINFFKRRWRFSS